MMFKIHTSVGHYTENTISLINREMWGTSGENRWRSIDMSCPFFLFFFYKPNLSGYDVKPRYTYYWIRGSGCVPLRMSCPLVSLVHHAITSFDDKALLCIVFIQTCIHQRFTELSGSCRTTGLVNRTSSSADIGHSIFHEPFNRPIEIPRS